MRSDHQDLIRDDGSSGGNENGKHESNQNQETNEYAVLRWLPFIIVVFCRAIL